MEQNANNFDPNSMPKHLLVKSQKQAKKLDKQQDAVYNAANEYKKIRRFKLPIEN